MPANGTGAEEASAQTAPTAQTPARKGPVSKVLEVVNLKTIFHTRDGAVHAGKRRQL